MSTNHHIPTVEQLEPRLLLSGDALSGLFAAAVPLSVAASGTTGTSDYVTGLGPGNMYKFTTKARGKFYINMIGGGGLDPCLSLYNQSGRRVAFNNNAGGTTNSLIRRGVKANQTYYILASTANDLSGSYSLSLSSIPVDDFGNALASARARRLRRDGAGRINGKVNYATDTDYFRIIATQTGLVRLGLSSPGRRNVLQGQLSAYDAAGTLLASGAEGEISFDVVAGQAYYLKAAGANDTTGRYRINIRPTRPAFLDASSEVDPPASGALGITGSIGPGGEGAYKFTTDARGRFYIEMNAAGGGIDPYLTVYDVNGKRVRFNDNASRGTLDSLAKLSVRASQTYYVVASAAGGTSGTYNLTLRSVPIDDYGNTLAAAKAMRLNRAGRARAKGRIQYGSDVDVLALVAAKTGTIQADMNALGRRNNLSSELFAYDAAGNLLTDSSEVEGAQISFNVTAGQWYYISAASSDTSTGRYSINIINNEAALPAPGPLQDAPQPDGAIRTQVASLAGGSQLVIRGTDAADTITLSQSSSYMTLTTASGTQRISGTFAAVVVYGFGGDDTITLTHSVSAASWVFAGDGNDSVFDAGTGAGALWGGAGDDLLVTVGGGADTLTGGSGLDSFWSDSSDTVSDASAAENVAGTVHRITAFYQPHTTNRASVNYVSLEIAGQNYLDPALTGYASRYANFVSTAVFVDGAQYDDVEQGMVGDCYYLAVLSSLADTDPNIVEQMITPLGDGTYAVRFHRNGNEVYLRLDADLPVTYSGSLAYARINSDGELWVPLVEKAYAYFRYGANSYASISGGWMSTVNREITNTSSLTRWTGGTTAYLYQLLSSSLASGHAVTLGSYSRPQSPIVGSHAYVVMSVETVGADQFVTVFNPWGVDGRSWDNNYYDGLLTISIDQVQSSFSAVVVSLA